MRSSWLPEAETDITIACLTYLSYHLFACYISQRDTRSQDSDPVWYESHLDGDPDTNESWPRLAVEYDADWEETFWSFIN